MSKKLAIARAAWNPAKMAEQHDDVRLKMLCYAILAPNPHNKQPWSVELSDRTLLPFTLTVSASCR